MAETVMHEFLVGLGWKEDEKSREKVDYSIRQMILSVDKMAVAMGGAVTAVAVGVAKIADSLAGLYYKGQALQTTAKDLEALGYAFTQAGEGADAGMASFERFARRLQDSPGFRKMLEPGAFAGVGKTGETFVREVQALQRKYAAAQTDFQRARIRAYAESRDIDPDLLTGTRAQDLRRFYDDWIRKYGQGFDENARKAAEFERALNTLKTALKETFTEAGAAILRDYRDTLNSMARTVDEHRDGIIAFIKDFLTQIERAAHDLKNIFLPVLELVKGMWDEVAEAIYNATGGETDIRGMKGMHVALDLLVGAVMIAKLGKMALAVGAVAAAFYSLYEILNAIKVLVDSMRSLFSGGGAQAAPAAPGPTLPGGAPAPPETMAPGMPGAGGPAPPPPETTAPGMPGAAVPPAAPPPAAAPAPAPAAAPSDGAARPRAGAGFFPLSGGAAARGEASSLGQMDPEFLARLQDMYHAMPADLREGASIFSGYRSPELQARLYRTGRPGFVARGGHSQHGFGRAVDMHGSPAAMQWMHEHAHEFGLHFPLLHARHPESWHLEPEYSRGPDPAGASAEALRRRRAGGKQALRNPLRGVQLASNALSMFDPDLMHLRGAYPKLNSKPLGMDHFARTSVADNRSISSETNIHVNGAADSESPSFSYPRDASLLPRLQLRNMQGMTA